MTTTGVDRIAGLSGSVAIKAPCQYRTTANITLSGLAVQAGGTWGSTLTQDDSNPTRILVHNQANPVDNGVWNPGSGTWQRARDFNGSRDVVQGTLVHVYQDATDLFYELTTVDPVIGTSSLAFAGVDSVALSTILARLTSTSVVSDGAAMIGRGGQVVDSIAALRLLLKTSPSVNAFATGYYAAYDGGGGPYRYDPTDTTTADNGGTVIVAADGGRWKLIHDKIITVKQFGAKGDGSTDDTAAITAADTAACAGTLDSTGNTVKSEFTVVFPPGRYKVTSTLTYRGAPWRGAGVADTFIDFFASSGALIDAVGTNGARKLLNITDMTLNGSNCTGTSAYCFRLGYNQRSQQALARIKIYSFPGPGIHFAAPCWMMSFHDVYIAFCARDTASLRTGIYLDPGLGALQLLAFDWYNLWLEDNGFAGSAVGGGMDISTNAVDSWNFHGGTWEGNYGIAEARFKAGVNIHVNGVYVEAFHTRVVNGLLFDGVFGSANNCRVTVSSGATGDGIKCIGASLLTIDKMYSNINWVNDISTADTSRVMLGESAVLNFSVGAGSRLIRRDPELVTLSHALTIATNAAKGTDFTVTIFDNDTMGAPTNPSIGQRIKYTIIQSGVGAHTMAWNAVFKVSWSNTGNVANARSSIEFQYNGTNWNQCSAQAPYVV